MIIEYLRPDTVDEAVDLLRRETPLTLPVGGGTVLNRQKGFQFAVVDLQGLGLDQLVYRKNILKIGSTTSLHVLSSHPKVYPALKAAIQHEANYNIRQVATVAGTLMAGDGRSPIIAVMLALAAKIQFASDKDTISLSELLPFRKERYEGKLVTEISISTNLRLAYNYVARTPADRPLVCACVAQWPSKRTRVVLGGYGESPLVAFDGPNGIGADIAARDAYQEAADSYASAEYRSDIVGVLVKRGLNQIKSSS